MFFNEMTISYVTSCIKNYLHFCGISEFPNVKIIPFSINLELEKKKNLGYVVLASQHYNCEQKSHTLNVWEKLWISGGNAEHIVFHELTHICDTEKYVKNKETNVAIKGYTEYHASQIEMIRALGWKSINDEVPFSLTKNINLFLDNCSLYEYVLVPKLTAEKLIARNDFPKNQETLMTVLALIFNYLGRLSICKMYSTDYEEYQVRLEVSKAFSSFLNDQVYKALLDLLLRWPTDNEIEALSLGFLRILLSMSNQYNLITQLEK